MIPLCKPYFDEKEINAVKAVLDSGWLAHGPVIEKFEKEFSAYIGTKYAVAVNSCTSALEICCKLLPIGSEVIVPSFTWVASVNAILANGLIPVFCEVDIETRNIDTSALSGLINKNTSAVMAVHYGGLPANLLELNRIAKAADIMLIEDSAETIGGMWSGVNAGSVGLGCFSFYPTKNMTCGEGGVLTTNDEEVYTRAIALRGHGISTSARDRELTSKPWERRASMIGHNFRMSDVVGAIALEQLNKLEWMNNRRIEIASQFNLNLSADFYIPPFVPQNARHVYQTYSVLVKDGIDRDDIVMRARQKGVLASVHFAPPVHRQKPYEAYFRDLPNTDYLSTHIISLPIYPGLAESEIGLVTDVMNEVANEVR